MSDLLWHSMVQWLSDSTELEVSLQVVDQIVEHYCGRLKY